MSSFVLHTDRESGHTLVPDFFLDEYMPSANGEYVKVYLFLLRCLKSDTLELSIPLIADKFDHTETDVCRALKYWEKMNLLKLEYDSAQNLTGICLNDQTHFPAKASSPETSVSPSAETQAKAASAQPSLSDAEAKQLLFVCEQYLGKPLSASEMSRLLDFHDSFGFSADLIEYLVEYCVCKRHKNIRYIETVAAAWHEAGYTTVAQAKEQTNTYNKAYFSILKAFGISNRNPVDVEITYMNKWLREYGFSTELVTEACSRTMAAIHQPSFEYADKILNSWKKEAIKSPADLKLLDSKRRSEKPAPETASQKGSASNRFFNFQQRDYDFNELEKQLINQ